MCLKINKYNHFVIIKIAKKVIYCQLKSFIVKNLIFFT